ncbi:hypothetical protein N7523_005754 [Penicillium sp. IBT 18751x]|nr:hypothetical protein N7523_005654 [Penicillium sp. IBT 18751x]KAJ6118003.1 hypothetical protein N7523_005754 [Penicillium sp. IBT 18751x]
MRLTDPALTLCRLTDSSDCIIWSAKPGSTNVPAFTLWHRANGRSSPEEKAEKQLYLTDPKEKALKELVLRFAKNDFPSTLTFLRSLAYLLVQRRSSLPLNHHTAKPPSPGWPRKFFKRHAEVKPRKSKPIYWKRHDHNIHSQVAEWFSIIGPELHDPTIHPVNIHNMDGTGVMLSGPHSLKVLVGKVYGGSREARVNREAIIAIECVSANGRSLQY